MATATESTSDKNTSRDSSASPWPDVEVKRIVFLLDVRDDFEARLLRDWVDAAWTASGSPPRHSFIRLPKRHGGNLVGALAAEGDDVWMQPLRIAWLPSARRTGRFSVQDLFAGRIAEPGNLRRRWQSL